MPNGAGVPYTPGFGLVPPVLAGRDQLLDDLYEAIAAGPGHPRFVSAIIGHRGVGKTSVLDVIGRRVEHHLGWAVLHRQAVRDGDLLADIASGLPEAIGRWSKLGRDFRQLEKQLSVSVNLGVVSANATVTSAAKPDQRDANAFPALLRQVGSFAAKHRTGLLLTVDEASTARRPDLSALAGAIQTEVNRGRLPVAVVFSGLPEFREAIANAGTFAERLAVTSLEDLNPDATRLALLQPAGERGVTWHTDALDHVAGRAGGHPYYVQLFGYHTWRARGDSPVITVEHATAGVEMGMVELHGQFETTWHRLRPQEQAVLAAIASIGGDRPVAISRIGEALGRTPAQLDVARNRLIRHHGLIRSAQRGEIQYRSRAFASWVASSAPEVRARADEIANPARQPTPASGPVTAPKQPDARQAAALRARQQRNA
jgi:hypothetical protein